MSGQHATLWMPAPEACPLCGEDVIPAEKRLDSGVAWGTYHAHALCALHNLAHRVTELERVIDRLKERSEPTRAERRRPRADPGDEVLRRD